MPIDPTQPLARNTQGVGAHPPERSRMLRLAYTKNSTACGQKTPNSSGTLPTLDVSISVSAQQSARVSRISNWLLKNPAYALAIELAVSDLDDTYAMNRND